MELPKTFVFIKTTKKLKLKSKVKIVLAGDELLVPANGAATFNTMALSRMTPRISAFTPTTFSRMTLSTTVI